MGWSTGPRLLGLFILVLVNFALKGSDVLTCSDPTQEDLDYIASYLIINFTVISNYHHTYDKLSRILFKNGGTKVIECKRWTIYFSSMSFLDSHINYDPIRNKSVLSPFELKPVVSTLYQVVPIKGIFTNLKPRENVTFFVTGPGYILGRTNIMPNWYIASPELQPRIIDCTKGDNLEYVSKFSYKEARVKGDSDPDVPWSTQDRFIKTQSQHYKSISFNKHDYSIIPTPTNFFLKGNSKVNFKDSKWFIYLPSESRGYMAAVSLLQEKAPWLKIYSQANLSKIRGRIIFRNRKTKIRGKNSDIQNESYDLEINTKQQYIDIVATHEKGAIYAIISLISLLDDEFNLPGVSISDSPRFAYRGVHLDVARNFRPLRDVTLLIDAMSRYKLNVLHLHLADDEGWRLEIPDIPELVDLGSRRCHDLSERTCLLPVLGSGPFSNSPNNGYYSTSDYREILSYGKSRNVKIIPEFDMPGHARAAIKSMLLRYHRKMAVDRIKEANQYLLTEIGDMSEYMSVQNFNDSVLNPCIPSTYTFVNKIIKTLYTLHEKDSPLTKFHFGGDEVPTRCWSDSRACKRLLQRENVPKKNHSAFLKLYFRKQLGYIINLFPKLSLHSWDDAILDGSNMLNLSEDVDTTLHTWKNIWEPGMAYKLANFGYEVVLSHATHLYFDHPQEPDPEERGIFWATRYTDLQKVFLYKPLNVYNIDVKKDGDHLTFKEANCNNKLCPHLKQPQNIVGMEASLWGEYIRNREHMFSQLFPRLLALAERSWHEANWENMLFESSLKASQIDWRRFANTVGHKELKRLDKLGVEYRIPPPGARINGSVLQTNSDPPGLRVEFSLNGGCTWTDAHKDVIVPEAVKVLLRTISADGRRSRIVVLNENGRFLSCPHLYFSTFMFNILMVISMLLCLKHIKKIRSIVVKCHNITSLRRFVIILKNLRFSTLISRPRQLLNVFRRCKRYRKISS